MNQAVAITNRKGIAAAMFAALLFGLSTPLNKLLLNEMEPLVLAGLLYLGSGLGLLFLMAIRHVIKSKPEAPLQKADIPWLAGAIALGGIAGPALLLLGLTGTSSATASLLTNLEGASTAALAWLIFREHCNRAIVVGMGLATAGGMVLAYQPGVAVWSGTWSWGALMVVAACICWGIDNNLTRKISASDPVQIACIKGLVAGSFNLTLALSTGSTLPAATNVLQALLLGFCCYGVSLSLYIVGLRLLGTARTGAYFATAPFAGAIASVVLLRDPITLQIAVASGLLGASTLLHLTEVHEHEHSHEELDHEHMHTHDEHHQHDHEPGDPPGEPHSHRHVHAAIKHSHPHFPDIHHRHPH